MQIILHINEIWYILTTTTKNEEKKKKKKHIKSQIFVVDE